MKGESGTPAHQPQRRARVRPEHSGGYPLSYHGLWFRVVERHDPDVPVAPGDRSDIMGRNRGRGPAGAGRALRDNGADQAADPVVDDDPSIRRTLQIALSNAGYEVLQAQDGEEAIRLWHETGPDLILTDIHMPRKSGLLLIEELQGQPGEMVKAVNQALS
jgi:hypothetical protein